MNRQLRASIAIAFAAAAAACSQRREQEQPLSTARLVCEVESIRPATPFTAGMLITLADGWHTYWKDPGDSGMAPIFEWHLPEGFGIGPVQWPEPIRLETPPLVNYVYEHEVLLMFEVTPAPDVAPGDEVKLVCDFSWLICNEVCLARDARLELVMPVRAEEPKRFGAWHEMFERTRKRL